jgi:RNA polymerase sigma factor (sigma-70 family)
MASRDPRGGMLQDVRTLFDAGTTVGLTDAELLGRFADHAARDAAAGPAFAALLDRHGPMVLRVCRSILKDEHDAQDAFQTTFLVLVRRADAVRRRESTGSWLHGVALRVAVQARANMARRRRHERRAGELAVAADRTGAEGASPEVAAILHEELSRLPERYREAIVLCYLEGHTCESAARRLGWPVGTVKSRLTRGRNRLRGRLVRRGLAPISEPDATSDVAPAVVIPAALARITVEAMLEFAASRPIDGAVSAVSISWTLQTLRTMLMTRFAMMSALLILGLAVTGAAMIATQDRGPDQTRSVTPTKTTVKEHEAAKPAVLEKKVEMLSVRVVDTSGRNVADALVKVVEFDGPPMADWPGYRNAAHRTGADGRVRVAVDRQYRRVTFESRPDDRTLGWASLRSGELLPKATDEDPITLMLLPRIHQVEGIVVDTRGKPIRGAQVRAVQFNHDANGFRHDYPDGDQKPSLAWAVTDETGRFLLHSLPKDTTATLAAYHPRFVGPTFVSKPDDQTIPSVTLEDAGGVTGTVVDAETGQPVKGASLTCQRIEHTDRILVGNWGRAISDAQGHFAVSGLAPGVYNLLFQSSPKGRRFTAPAVEGLRVNAGEDARADLRMIAGRRVHGTAVGGRSGQPLVGTPICCYSASHPRSGAACQGTYTDEQGHFEHFVPPGSALVYIAEPGQFGLEYRNILNVPDDRDPDPIVLKQGDDPNTKQPPGGSGIVECEARVRLENGAPDRPGQNEDRTLTGRVFDKGGSLLVGVQVYYNSRTLNEAATDRQGLFRLKGLPQGPLRLGLRSRHSEREGWVRIPADAVEIDLIFPQ